MATDDKSSQTADLKKLDHPQKHWLGVRGYDKITEEYDHDGKLSKVTREHQRGKTAWDWLQLLIIPFVIGAGAIWFNYQQNQQSSQASQVQHANDQKIANQQHEVDRQLAKDQQQQEALVTYEKDISDLLLIHHLGSSNEDVGSRVVADVRTLSTLQVLDPTRKGLLVYFLADANLISASGPIVVLVNADLSGAYLVAVGMPGDDLRGSDLSGAKLGCWGTNVCANLSGDKLGCYSGICTDLERADLSGADLSGADLERAYLSGANLKGANLKGVNLQGAFYNTKPIQETAQGNPLTLEPTQWPQGFDPVSAGLKCVDC